MAAVNITKRTVDGLKPAAAREFFVWDSAVKGFGVRVQPSGAMSYVVKYRAGSGRTAPSRRMTIGKTGTLTPEQARSIARKTLGAVANGADPAAQRAAEKRASTLREVAEEFLTSHAEAKKAKNTAESYRSVLERLVLPELGSRKADKVTSADLVRLHVKLQGTPAQANRVLRVVSSLYSYAATAALVPKGYNPAKGIEKFDEEGRERYLTTAELSRLGEAVREAETVGLPYAVDPAKPKAKHAPKEDKRRVAIGEHAAAAIRLLILTGARLREILHLRWDQIDFERGMLMLPTSKTGKKTIVLNAPALAVLKGLTQVGSYVIASASAGNANEKPRADLKKPWAAVAKRADLQGVRIHDLRHTHASIGAGAGLGLPIIGKLLGHTQASTTSRYAHLDDDPIRRASEHIGSRIASAMGDVTGKAAEVTNMQRVKR